MLTKYGNHQSQKSVKNSKAKKKKKKGMERIQNEIYREMIINKNYPFSYSLKYDLCMQFTENQFYNFYLSEKKKYE